MKRNAEVENWECEELEDGEKEIQKCGKAGSQKNK